MYWIQDTEVDEEGTKWLIFNYFEIVKIGSPRAASYNPVSKMYNYYPSQQLIIKAAMSPSLEEFEVWYDSNKKL